jgi:DNA-binding NarL/FixJ family response regulator
MNDKEIERVTEAEAEPRRRARPTKFTPERMRQITNLVERGKSREEIAEIIGSFFASSR